MATSIKVIAAILMLSIFSVCCQECNLAGDKEFPVDFKFGAATSAYQVEGGWDEDGRAPSIWDTVLHETPELIRDGSNGDIATDSYHKYQLDVDALKEAGFQYYRFSMSWSRILPSGQVPSLNPKGIAYYNNLINALLQAGIEPYVTMYHWDLPQALQDMGGWTNPLIVDYFADYADVLYKNFGDRVKRWITFNEPFEFAYRGYGRGDRPPFIEGLGVGEYLAIHHMLLSHAKAYHIYQDDYVSEQNGLIGITCNVYYNYPKDETVDPSVVERGLQYNLGWITHPIFSEEGGYPPIMVQDIANHSTREGFKRSRLPEMTNELKEYIRGTGDFIGLNYYSSRLIEIYPYEDGVQASYENDAHFKQTVNPSWPKAKSSWIYSVPEGLRAILNWIHTQYNGVKIIITENGWTDDGELMDIPRVVYFRDHLQKILEAIYCDGVNIIGYTAWSIVDNFEWMAGYTEKFGIYYIDFNTTELKRVPKLSSKFWQKVNLNRRIPQCEIL